MRNKLAPLGVPCKSNVGSNHHGDQDGNGLINLTVNEAKS